MRSVRMSSSVRGCSRRRLRVHSAAVPPSSSLGTDLRITHKSHFIDDGSPRGLSFSDGLGVSALVTPLFDVILIETHNECTRTCWFCKFGQDRQDPEQSQMA